MVRKFFYSLVLILLLFSTGCPQVSLLAPAETAVVPTPESETVETDLELPDVKLTAQAYLDAWKAGDYAAMYALLK